jgi:hypothetical protein
MLKGRLTVDPLEENVEDAMAWDCELVFVEKRILDSLLVVLVAAEVVVLQMVQEAACDRSNALDVHLGRTKLLL